MTTRSSPVPLTLFLIIALLVPIFSPNATPAYAATDCSNVGATGIPQVECNALVALYNSTNGPDGDITPDGMSRTRRVVGMV